jgi:hypothetical protein
MDSSQYASPYDNFSPLEMLISEKVQKPLTLAIASELVLAIVVLKGHWP